MKRIAWIEKAALLILHDKTIMVHGGSRGMRDEGLLDSALARPRNLLAYRAKVTLAQLGAAYAFGIARNHPFVDGNKRAAIGVLGMFLKANGLSLAATKVDATLTFLRLAAGEITEEQLAAWVESNLAR